MPDEDNNIGGSSVLDVRKWHVHAKNEISITAVLWTFFSLTKL